MKSLLGFLGRRIKALSDESSSAQGVQDLLGRGDALEQRGDFEGACSVYAQATQRAPTHVDAHLRLGNAQFAAGRTSEAIGAYRRVLELQPDNLTAHLNIGAILLGRGAAAEAERSYRAALGLRAASVDALAGLACALEMRGDAEGAAGALGRALELDPAHEGAASRYAQLLRARGQAAAALRVLADALQRNPASVVLLQTLAEIEVGIGEYARALAASRRILALVPGDAAAYSNLLWTLNFVPELSAQEILQEHRRFGEMIEHAVPRIELPRRATPQRIRIGYVSPDLRRHSVSCFIEPLLRHHDRSAFEVHCFYDHSAWDDVTDRLHGLAERWHDIAGVSDEGVAARIVSNEIDVLVDLAGHSAHNRMRLFAMKPAPLQCTWLGYLCTTGLRTIDYRLCDAYSDPPGVAEAWQVERPLRLPDSQLCYQPQVALPPASPQLPQQRNGFWTFGSFNQESKLSESTLAAWVRVLSAFPDSRIRILGVTCDLVAERIRRHFDAGGISGRRVELVGRIAIEEYLASYRDVDVALDSFPYNGCTTTCDALLMGVPVAAVAGHTSIARGGVSLLSTARLSDWIAASADDLVAMLQRHLAEPRALAVLRAELPQRMRASALMDAPRFTSSLETLLREAVRAAAG